MFYVDMSLYFCGLKYYLLQCLVLGHLQTVEGTISLAMPVKQFSEYPPVFIGG